MLQLKCENCGKKFSRLKSAVSEHNYCSRSCSVIVNNHKHPKRIAEYATCTQCQVAFKKLGRMRFCSEKCRHLGKQKHTKANLLEAIGAKAKILGRTPSKRELGEVVSSGAFRLFGSLNKAIEKAGLQTNRSDDNRMYRRTRTKARDGHMCDSVSEALIDNWLHQNKISHGRDSKYPTTNHRADWSIKNGKIFIEYFGLAKDSPRYDREIKIKKNLCKKNGITLLEIYPSDLYPTVALDKKLGVINP